MPDAKTPRHTGPRTYECAEDITGGKLCEARAGGLIAHARPGSLNALGVAATDGTTPDSHRTTTLDVSGVPTATATYLRTRVELIHNGREVEVTYAAAAAFGDKLKAATDGDVTPMQPGDDPRALVGTCTQPRGVPAGAKGWMGTA